MKTKLLFWSFLISIGNSFAQWTSVPTPFSPFNGYIKQIDVGSQNEIICVADATDGSSWWWSYKFNTTTNSWDAYQSPFNLNISYASIGSDGTTWTSTLNGSTITNLKNNVLKPGTFKRYQVRNASQSIAYNPGTTYYGPNLYLSNASDVFTIQSDPYYTSLSQMDIGEDGTIMGITYGSISDPKHLAKYVNGAWVFESTPSGLNTWSHVAVGDATKILAVRNGLLYYKDPVTGNYIQDLTAPANVSQASIASDGTVYLLTSAFNNNVYRNTWSGILCGAIPVPTFTENVIYTCPGSTATFNASATGTISWYDSPSATTPVATGTTFTSAPATSQTTYYVENNVNGCKSQKVTATVAMSAAAATPVNTTPTANLTVCPGQSTTLTAAAHSSSSTTNHWFTTNTGSSSIGSGNSFTVPGNLLNTTSTFYLQSIRTNGCKSSYVPITVTVQSAPAAPVNATPISSSTICTGESTTLNVTGAGTVVWFSDASATTQVGTGLTFTTPVLTNSASYYARINGATCNSILTPVSVTVNQNTSGIHTISACSSYQWINGQTYTTNNTTATHTLTNSNGCDSVVTLNLTITQPSTHSFSAASCNSYTWNNQTYNASGTYTQTLTNSQNCDSVVTLNLTIKTPTVSTLTQSACGSYTLNGQTYNTTGAYTQMLTNVAGCDSTITLNLTILNPTSSTVSGSACGAYTLNNQTYTNSGTYTQTLSNSLGCDSIITVQVTILEPTTATLNIEACDEYELNGQTYNSNGTYTQTLTNQAGCDSIVTLHLTLMNNMSTINENACGSYVWNGQTISTSGAYQHTYTNVHGCDSVVTLNLTINQIPTATVSVSNNVLTVAETGYFYQWYDCTTEDEIDGATNSSFSPNANGSYAVMVSTDECYAFSDCENISTIGIADLSNPSFLIYPNPAKSLVYLTQVESGASVSILDETGRKLAQETISGNTHTLVVSFLEMGVYWLQVELVNGTQIIQKLIKE